MARTGIRGTQIKDETIESVDIASGSIKKGELSAEAVSSQTAITTVDTTNDMLLIFDATDSALKKVAPTNLGVGGSGSPGGSDTQVQFNDGSSFGGDSGLTFNKTSGLLTVAKGAVFNEGSHDSDFRVESNDDANMLFVNAGTNRVGIGTDAPTALLHISSSAIGVLFRIDHPDAGVDNPIFFVTGSSGNSRVGIGTETPDATFAISDNGKVLEVGSADEGSWLEVNNGTVYLNLGGGKTIAGGDDLGQRFNISPINTTAGALGIGKYPGATVNIVEVNSENSDQGGDFFVINSSGKVGIGKTSPTHALHVANGGPSSLYLEADTDNVDEDDTSYIKFTQDGGNTGTVLGLCPNSASKDPEGVAYTGALGSSFLIGTTTSTPIQFGTNDNVRMTIKQAGNVGIGTTSPGVKLDVSGDVNFDGGAVFNESSADKDFRVESNGNANMLFVNGGTDRVGIATSSPSTLLDVSGSAKANTFVTTPALTDLGSGTATHLTSSNGVHFLDADSVTLASGKTYHELYLAPGSINGQHIQLTITSSANNPVKLMGDSGGDKAQGTVSFSGAPANGQTVSFPNVGGGTTYTVTWDTSSPGGEFAITSATNVTVGIGGITSANDFASMMDNAIQLGIGNADWPFTVPGTYAGGTSVTLSQASAGSGNETITENSDNTTVSGFSGGTALVEGTLNSTYGVALAGTSDNGSLLQGAHLIYDSNSEKWQVIAGTQLTS